MNVNPCCQGCGKPYVHAKAIHAAEQNRENWFCQECATEQAQVHKFDPNGKRVIIEGRETMSIGEYVERGAIAVCDYSSLCNPDEFGVADLLTDLGHLCDREGHNFRVILRRAVRNWEAEG